MVENSSDRSVHQRDGSGKRQPLARWGTALSRWAERDGKDQTGAAADPGRPVLVDEYGGLVLLRSTPTASPSPSDAAALARVLAVAEPGDEVATVVVGVDGSVTPTLWTRLAELLDTLQRKGAATVRLVLSGAGAGTPEHPALAQRIADAWDIRVLAPEGAALVVPGGTLFVVDGTESSTGWQLFQRGAEPLPLGQRSPAPFWQTAVAGLPSHTASGSVIEQIPAGLLVRPPRSAAPRPEDLCYLVPVDPDQLTVLVGAPGPGGDADVPADDLADLLTALPTAVRTQLRFAPGNHRDLLPAVQKVADSLGIEVELLTGPPRAPGSAGIPEGVRGARPVLVDTEGSPTWRPFVEAVVCHPAAPGRTSPRLLRRRAPLVGPDTGGAEEQGVIPLSDTWQVTLTRAGLAIGPAGQARPLAGRLVAADQMAIEINVPGKPLDESFYLALSQLLMDVDPDVQPFVTLHVLSRSAAEDRRLRRLAIRHEVRMMWPPGPETPPGKAAGPESTGTRASGTRAAGSAEFREPINRIVAASNDGRYDDASSLALTLEQQVFSRHGEASAAFLEVRQIRAHIARLASQESLATVLYLDVALKMLAARGPEDPETEQAASNADACWRAVRDDAEALRIGPSIISLRGNVPGAGGHHLRAAENYLARLKARLPAPASELPSEPKGPKGQAPRSAPAAERSRPPAAPVPPAAVPPASKATRIPITPATPTRAPAPRPGFVNEQPW